MTSDRSERRGLFLMLLGTACFVGMACLIKSLRESGLSTPQVIFARMAPALVWVALAMHVQGQRLRPHTASPIFWRCATGLLATSAYFYALQSLSLIENAVLHLLQPVFVAMIAPAVLGERLQWRSSVALVIALTGAMIVVRPGEAWRGSIPLLPVLAGVVAAIFSAISHTMVRKATANDTPERVVFWFTASTAACSLVMVLVSGGLVLPVDLELSTAAWQILAMAGLGLAGQLLMTRAYGRASAPKVAMIAYASIPLSIVADIAWGVVPGVEEIIGSIVMVGAGVLLVLNRRQSI